MEKGTQGNHSRGKRILALIGAALLAILYLSTLAFALLGEEFMNCLLAAVYCTIGIPVLLWAYGFISKLRKGCSEKEPPKKK